MSLRAQKVGLFFGVILAVFMTFQLVLYRQYAFEATWLYMREVIGVSTSQDKRNHGAICNSLGRVRCSIRIFTSLADKFPNDQEALSNLAMALVMGKNAAAALPYFKAYFSSGGRGFDVMYWYGRALQEVGLKSEAIPWFYGVLYYQVDNDEVTKALLATLRSEGRRFEALSLIRAIREQKKDTEGAMWKSEYNELLQAPRDVASAKNSAAASDEILIPALDGHRYYVPFYSSHGLAAFLPFDESNSETVLEAATLKKLGGLREGPRGRIAQLKVGPFALRDVIVNVCEGCPDQISGRLLQTLSPRIDGRGKVPFLVLKGE